MIEASEYQKAIYKEVEKGSRSLIVNAVAGSGKTTTIINSLGYISDFYKVLFLAFNKGIVETLKLKAPPHVKVQTFHGFGFTCMLQDKKFKKPYVNSSKVRKLYNTLVGSHGELEDFAPFVCKLVSLAKQHGIHYCMDDTYENWLGLVNHYALNINTLAQSIEYIDDIQEQIAELDYDLTKWQHDEAVEEILVRRYIGHARQALRKSNIAEETIDFDDMIYFPLLKGMPITKYNIIFLDEAQDTNTMRRKLLEKALAANGRVIAVGDKNQSIFQFTGVDVNSMGLIQKTFNAKELPLSLCYRSGKNIVRAAQEYVPHMEFWENSPEGTIKTLKNFRVTGLKIGDRVLCRNTAPLVPLAYKLLIGGIPVAIVGKSIGFGLIALINKFRFKNLKELKIDLNAYTTEKISEYTVRKQLNKIEPLLDRVQSLMAILSSLTLNATKKDIIGTVKELFRDKGIEDKVLFSTIHKAKGLEWKRVYILDWNLLPSKYAVLPWQQEQERNLMYVAITRAKEELYFIRSDDMV